MSDQFTRIYQLDDITPTDNLFVGADSSSDTGRISLAALKNYLINLSNPSLDLGQISSDLYKFNQGNDLQIATGVITVNSSLHRIDTQSLTPADDLDTINSSVATNSIVIISTVNDNRTVSIKNGTGNIFTPDGSNILLDKTFRYAALINVGTSILPVWNVISHTGNISSNTITVGSGGINNNGASYLSGTVDPEGSVTANPGSIYSLTNSTGGAVYIKELGTGNSGWRKKFTSSAVNAKDFGAKGDGVTDDTIALQSSLSLAITLKTALYIPDGVYICTTSLSIPSGMHVFGDGIGRVSLNTLNYDDNGSIILFAGTGAKNKTLDFVSNMNISGGKILNPAFGQVGSNDSLAEYYSLYNFTNGNASGVTPATLKQFSVGMYVEPGGGTVLSNFRIMVGRAVDGTSIYRNATHTGLADDWDVGLYLDNHTHARVENVASIGYWRVAGLLDTWGSKSPSESPSSEYNLFTGCQFQGYHGIQLRGPDSYTVTAVGPTTLQIGWSGSHRIPSSGNVRIGSIIYAYTGTSFSGDKLTFTGIPSTSGAVVGNLLRPTGTNNTGNFGSSGTLFLRCNVTGLGHASRCLATSTSLSPRFTDASSFVSASGNPCREIRFLECTFLGSDEVAIHLHDCNDIQFTNCYGEGQTAREFISGAFNIPAGARIIASPFVGNNTRATYPAGETGQLRDIGSDWNESLDFTPFFESTNVTRFGNYGGLFSPRNGILLGKSFKATDNELNLRLPPNHALRIGSYTGNTTVYVNSGELDLQTATIDDIIRFRNGTNTALRISKNGLELGPSGPIIGYGMGSPENVVTGNIGSLFLRGNGGSGTSLYIKESGNGTNTGWALVTGGAGSGVGSNLTIASDTITINSGYHVVDTEASASTDNLSTINGGIKGQLVRLQSTSNSRSIIIKHNIGNIVCDGMSDISLDRNKDIVELLYNGANWLARLFTPSGS